MTNPVRVAQIVKYYPPSQRISGVIGFLTALNRYLGSHLDLTVITSAVDGAPARESTDSYRVQRVPWPFPVSAAVALSRLDPVITLYVSSIFDRRAAALYFGGCHATSRMLGWRGSAIYFQATHLSERESWLFGQLLERMDQVCYSSPDAPADFRSAGSRFFELLPAVDLKALGEPSTNSGRRRVGFINHLNPVKGFDRALAMFQQISERLPGCEFVIAGTGVLDHLVPERIGENAVERHGWLPQPERVQVMRSCDALLFPFRTGVSVLGLSQTVIESMALGVVPVGTRTPSIEPLISDSVDGILYEDEGEAVDRLIQVLSDDATLTGMREAARARVASRFDARQRAKELANRLS